MCIEETICKYLGWYKVRNKSRDTLSSLVLSVGTGVPRPYQEVVDVGTREKRGSFGRLRFVKDSFDPDGTL